LKRQRVFLLSSVRLRIARCRKNGAIASSQSLGQKKH
jgi:hypothetical protein